MERAKVLVVDDDAKIIFAFRELLRKEGLKSAVATNGKEALKTILAERPDLIFMDITMPELDGLEVLRRVREHSNHAPVIIITGYGTMQTAIKAIQLGAFDYLTKPLDVSKIRNLIHRALAAVRGVPVAAEQRARYDADVVDRYELVGNSAAMQDVYKLIGSISTTPNHTSVLITGESGTGKELVARAIHAFGSTREEPFVGINCTVFPETLLESELFGHEKGAFTGAVNRRSGKFEFAGAGTIFLDEIGNLSLPLQQKLLRVLQEREFERVGGNTLIQVNARFIAATSTDLSAAVRNRTFREDLFFRLNVVTIPLPPLRERREDIPELASYFLTKYNDRLKKSIDRFSQEAMDRLLAYPFTGNVRELENLIERAVMLTKGNCILVDALGDMASPSSSVSGSFPLTSHIFSKARDQLLRRFEKQFLRELLTVHRGNVTAAAHTSRMTRQNFQRLMKKHKISSTRFRQG